MDTLLFVDFFFLSLYIFLVMLASYVGGCCIVSMFVFSLHHEVYVTVWPFYLDPLEAVSPAEYEGNILC